MSTTLRGALALIGATFFYGVIGLFSRMIGLDFGVMNQQWGRSLLILLACVLVMTTVRGQRPRRVARSDFFWLLVWAFCAAWPMLLLFVVINHLPVGLTYFLFYAATTVTSLLLGRILFAERLNGLKWIAAAFSLSGLLLIHHISLREFDFKYLLMASAAGILIGSYNVLSKKVSGRYPVFQLMSIEAVFAIGIAGTGAILLNQPLPQGVSVNAWIGLLLSATALFAATPLLVYGFGKLSVPTASLMMPLEIVFGVLSAILVLNESHSNLTWIGGGLIVLGAVLGQWQRKKVTNARIDLR